MKNSIKQSRLEEVAAGLYRVGGLNSMRRDEIARITGYAQGTVTNRLGTIPEMADRVIAEGIRMADPRIIAWAVVHRHPLVQHMTADTKLAALRAAFVD